MRQHDMKHLDHLLIVAVEDVEHLKMKEATYQGSWKRSGGRSAWFMLRRKIDRLLEMMKRPEAPHGWNIQDYFDAVDAGGEVTVDASIAKYLATSHAAEDVFAKIEQAPSGEDGSVLAEIRDLRRYLLLVEAEMISRGAVSPGAPKTERTVPRYSADPGQPTFAVLVDDEARLPTPWIVKREQIASATETVGDATVFERLYEDRGAGLMKLTTHLTEAQKFQAALHVKQNTSPVSFMIAEALRYYVPVPRSKIHVLRITHAPTDYRSAWPVFHKEYNGKELSMIEPWAAKMFVHFEEQGKWKIAEEFEAWTRESL
jgi:hypothetical protein